MSDARRWFVLGFTADEIVGCWQDSRLAGECVRAWQAEGKPTDFSILQSTSGDGEHMLLWFVNEVAARLLDVHTVGWRDFLISERAEVPAGAHNPLTEEAHVGPARKR
jgi:hypothetical protein